MIIVGPPISLIFKLLCLLRWTNYCIDVIISSCYWLRSQPPCKYNFFCYFKVKDGLPHAQHLTTLIFHQFYVPSILFYYSQTCIFYIVLQLVFSKICRILTKCSCYKMDHYIVCHMFGTFYV